jgi:hypothetical protein
VSQTTTIARQTHGALEASVANATTNSTTVPTTAATTRSGRRR